MTILCLISLPVAVAEKPSDDSPTIPSHADRAEQLLPRDGGVVLPERDGPSCAWLLDEIRQTRQECEGLREMVHGIGQTAREAIDAVARLVRTIVAVGVALVVTLLVGFLAGVVCVWLRWPKRPSGYSMACNVTEAIRELPDPD